MDLEYARRNGARFVEELKTFIRFPSVSAQTRHSADQVHCAAWLMAHLERIGLRNARMARTGGPPIVYADWMGAGGRPTILIYGHYDVQPPDPLEEWLSPPFDPQVRNGYIFGRGSCDDKGQVFAHLKAIETALRTRGRLPVNVRVLIEGEEEIGSPHLPDFLRGHRSALQSDVAVISDDEMPAPRQPAIIYSMRGDVSFEIEVRGPKQDVHSGHYGGVVHNPIQALCEMLARLHDREGRIAIDGLYDDVPAQTPRERAYMARVGALRERGTWGEVGFTPYERATIRPALTITGITGGYQGPGTKSIVPSRASAKLNLRLAPGQRPAHAAKAVTRHVARIAPSSVRVLARAVKAIPPVSVDRRHPVMSAAARALEKAFGRPPVFLRSGGSISAARLFQDILGVTPVLMAFGSHESGIHGPNERYRLADLFAAIEASYDFLNRVAAQGFAGQEAYSTRSGVTV